MDRTRRKQNIERRLWVKYVPMKVNGKSCFCTPTGRIVVVEKMPGENALVLGHADNLTEAELFRYEDGDRFYLDKMDEDAMFAAMIQEIEDN